MDKYRLVQEHKANDTDDSTISPNVPQVRITQQGKPRNYISYAMNLFVSEIVRDSGGTFTGETELTFLLAVEWIKDNRIESNGSGDFKSCHYRGNSKAKEQVAPTKCHFQCRNDGCVRTYGGGP